MDTHGSAYPDVIDISALAASLGRDPSNSGAPDLIQVGAKTFLPAYDEGYLTMANVDTQALIVTHLPIFD